MADLFSRILFSFLPLLLATPLPLPFFGTFAPFAPLENALFCRGRGTAETSERSSFRIDLLRKFGKEIPSRNLRENRSDGQGAVKGVYLKGLFAQGRLFYREMDCPVRFYREMDCPVRWSLATPSALESQSRVKQGSVVANPICKCRRHKAGHLQVRVAVGRRSTCVLKEAPLNKGPLGFPQRGWGDC